MAKVLMIYISTTGNTEMMAQVITGYLEYKEHDVDIKTFDFDPIDVEELLDYDLVLIGMHSSDDGEIPFEAEDFYEELDEVDLKGRLFGVFGSGDTAYDEFCLSIDLMADKLEFIGAKLVPERLKVDLTPNDDDMVRCDNYAEKAIQMLQTNAI